MGSNPFPGLPENFGYTLHFERFIDDEDVLAIMLVARQADGTKIDLGARSKVPGEFVFRNERFVLSNMQIYDDPTEEDPDLREKVGVLIYTCSTDPNKKLDWLLYLPDAWVYRPNASQPERNDFIQGVLEEQTVLFSW